MRVKRRRKVTYFLNSVATSMTSSTSSVTTTASMKSREEKAADRYDCFLVNEFSFQLSALLVFLLVHGCFKK